MNKTTLVVPAVIAAGLVLGGTPVYAAGTSSFHIECMDSVGERLIDVNGKGIYAETVDGVPTEGSYSPTGAYHTLKCENAGALPVFIEPDESESEEDRAHYEDAFFAENYAAYETIYNEDGPGWAYLAYPGADELSESPLTPEQFSEAFIAHMSETSEYREHTAPEPTDENNPDSDESSTSVENRPTEGEREVEVQSGPSGETTGDRAPQEADTPVHIAAGLEGDGLSYGTGPDSGGYVNGGDFTIESGHSPVKSTATDTAPGLLAAIAGLALGAVTFLTVMARRQLKN